MVHSSAAERIIMHHYIRMCSEQCDAMRDTVLDDIVRSASAHNNGTAAHTLPTQFAWPACVVWSSERNKRTLHGRTMMC